MINFINPYNKPLESHIYYNRISGMSRNNIIIDGQLFHTKKVHIKDSPEKISTIKINANTSEDHRILLFPESGNFYPIEIVISSLTDSVK